MDILCKVRHKLNQVVLWSMIRASTCSQYYSSHLFCISPLSETKRTSLHIGKCRWIQSRSVSSPFCRETGFCSSNKLLHQVKIPSLVQTVSCSKQSKNQETKNIIPDNSLVVTVPNILTCIRIALTPALVYLVLNEAYIIACGVFVVAGVTDMLDGYIARNFVNQNSALGSFMDPVADKILITSLFLSLTAVQLIPVSLTALVIFRDLCLVAAGFYIRYISLTIPQITFKEFFNINNPTAQLQPTRISKVNTAVQLSLIAITLTAPVFGFTDHPLLHSLWYLTAATTILSGGSYIFAKDTFRILKRRK